MVRVRIRFSVWSVSGSAHAFVLLSVSIITLPEIATFLADMECDH